MIKIPVRQNAIEPNFIIWFSDTPGNMRRQLSVCLSRGVGPGEGPHKKWRGCWEITVVFLRCQRAVCGIAGQGEGHKSR